MKLIEAMKLAKELQVKAADLREKIAKHSAYLSFETPVYADQKAQVGAWLQSHEDITREIAGLMVRVSRTNLATMVPIQIGGNSLSKPITEWIARRRTLAPMDRSAWASLTDRNLKEGNLPASGGGEQAKVTIIRCYDPVERDNKLATYQGEPGLIDRTLEVINAITDLLD